MNVGCFELNVSVRPPMEITSEKSYHSVAQEKIWDLSAYRGCQSLIY